MMIRTLIIAAIISMSIEVKSQEVQFNLENLFSEELSYDDVKGEVLTVFDFWATWCKPCINLMPKLNEIAESYADDERIKIVGVNIDDPRSLNKVRPFVNSLGVKYEVLLDTDQELADELGINAIPSLIIVDSKGDILWSHEGFSLGDEVEIKNKIEELLPNE